MHQHDIFGYPEDPIGDEDWDWDAIGLELSIDPDGEVITTYDDEEYSF